MNRKNEIAEPTCDSFSETPHIYVGTEFKKLYHIIGWNNNPVHSTIYRIETVAYPKIEKNNGKKDDNPKR
jgi:hypothetical protein